MKRSLCKAMVLATGIGIAVVSHAQAQSANLDPALASYTAVSGVSGNLKSVGSDTMNNLMALWAEGFSKHYPNVKIEVEGKGSGTAPPALTAGAAHFGPMSRQMKSAEKDEFEKKYGYKPTEIAMALDALAVYVNKDNPVKSLALEQLDGIFSKTRRSGYGKDIRVWSDVGVKGELAFLPISLYGRNSASGTYGYFKEHALFKGDYKDEVKEQPGSSSVVQAVASDKAGIGYSGIGYKTADVRTVPLSARLGMPAYEATAENVYSGDYPLARYLYIYVNKKPNEGLDPLRAQFLRFALSKEGQEAVVKDGFMPITAAVANEGLKALGLAK